MRKLVLMIVAGTVAMMLATPGVQATTVNWSTGSAYMEDLGNTYHTGFSIFPPLSDRWNQGDNQFDKVTLGTASGSLNLVFGTPQVVVVNPLTFEAGWTGDMLQEDTKTNEYFLTRDITVNGITKSLVNPITHGVTWAKDTLLVRAGAPVLFGDILVTPLGWTSPLDNGGGLKNGDVTAQFEVVPEPLTLLALGSALAGLVGYIRRRRLAQA